MLHEINIAQYMRNYSIKYIYYSKSTTWNTYMIVEIIHASGRQNDKYLLIRKISKSSGE